MSWLVGKSEFQSSLGIGNGSLSRDTLTLSTSLQSSENHTDCGPLENGKKESGSSAQNAEMGGSTSSRMLLDRSHQLAQPMRRTWVTRGELFYKEKARAAYKNRLVYYYKEKQAVKHK